MEPIEAFFDHLQIVDHPVHLQRLFEELMVVTDESELAILFVLAIHIVMTVDDFLMLFAADDTVDDHFLHFAWRQFPLHFIRFDLLQVAELFEEVGIVGYMPIDVLLCLVVILGVFAIL